MPNIPEQPTAAQTAATELIDFIEKYGKSLPHELKFIYDRALYFCQHDVCEETITGLHALETVIAYIKQIQK